MKTAISILIFTFLSSFSFGQTTNYNLDDGYIAEGYDVVAYFSQKAIEGKSIYSINYNGAKYKFHSKENLETFQANPSKFVPQYGGWCAYAMGAKKKLVTIDPETFEIRDGKLYLFYNSWGNNTKESWLEEGPTLVKKEADINWKNLKYAN